MEFEKVLHNNEWINVYTLNKGESGYGKTITINDSFKLSRNDKVSFVCNSCGIQKIETYKYKTKFFNEELICGNCIRKQTWLNKYGVDHVMKSKTYREKQSEYFSKNPTKGFQGHTHSKEVCEKLSKIHIGNKYACGKRTNDQRKNISITTKKALNNPIKRKKISDGLKGNKNALGHIMNKNSKYEMAKKVRIKYIERINKNREKGFQMVPFWNPKACDYFEQFDKDNNTQGQHARNGGEFYVKELGYWLDYVNHDLRLIIEYDEKYHKNQIEKDKKRQQEIQELYPNYEFRRILDY